MIILGCSLIDFYDNCDGSTGNYGKEVGINKYYSFREYHLYVEEKFNTSKNKMEYFSHHVFLKKIWNYVMIQRFFIPKYGNIFQIQIVKKL